MTPLSTVVLRSDDDSVLPLHPARWHAACTAEEIRLLSDVRGPVLDVGCGPGRLLEALARRGVFGLGVDPAATAVAMARQRGCAVLQRSVFERLPGEGRWRSLLLLDGNIGIGGDPERLLRRCRGLLQPGGEVIAEVEPPGSGRAHHHVRLERGPEVSAWFAWALVGADAINDVAESAGLTLSALEAAPDGRWFTRLLSPCEAACAQG